MKTFCLSLALCVTLSSWIFAADFIQNSNCGLTNPAFMEKFDQAYPGGKAGDVDESKWSISRFASEGIYGYQLADIPAVKAGAPATAYPDGDILVCDNTMPGYTGRLMVAIAGQNYGVTALRPHQPFDFAGRTGTVAFDVDVNSPSGLGHWVSFVLTEDPIPAPNLPNPSVEKNGNPRNGMFMNFSTSPNGFIVLAYIYKNYEEVQKFQSSTGVTGEAGKLNHIEVKVNQNRIEIWASDFSTDGATFPNFRMLTSADGVDLPFTKGYVNFCTNNHATAKYGFGRTGVHYWDNLAFDGPVFAADDVYQIPESLTPADASHMNTGWEIHDSASGGGAYSCCGAGSGKSTPFTFSNVDLANAASAIITFNAWYIFYSGGGAVDPTKVNLQYRLNSGAWKDRYLSAGEQQALQWTIGGMGEPWIPQIINVALSDLKQGNNTLDFRTINASSFPVAMANIELNLRGSGGATVISKIKPGSVDKNDLFASVNQLNGTVQLYLRLSETQRISLDIYSASGRHIRSLANGISIGAGTTDFTWNGTDAAGQKVGAGAYWVTMKSGNLLFEKRILKLR